MTGIGIALFMVLVFLVFISSFHVVFFPVLLAGALLFFGVRSFIKKTRSS